VDASGIVADDGIADADGMNDDAAIVESVDPVWRAHLISMASPRPAAPTAVETSRDDAPVADHGIVDASGIVADDGIADADGMNDDAAIVESVDPVWRAHLISMASSGRLSTSESSSAKAAVAAAACKPATEDEHDASAIIIQSVLREALARVSPESGAPVVEEAAAGRSSV